MTAYIVRIELHGPLADYPALHAWMQQQGFAKTIVGESGVSFNLPTAMYRINSDRSTPDLRDWLTTNLPPFGSNPDAWILVIEAESTAWRLKPA